MSIDDAPRISIKADQITPPWDGDLTNRMLKDIIMGELVPSIAVSVRLAQELFNIRKAVGTATDQV